MRLLILTIYFRAELFWKQLFYKNVKENFHVRALFKKSWKLLKKNCITGAFQIFKITIIQNTNQQLSLFCHLSICPLVLCRLSVVDLAGSERYCHTSAEGDRIKEASNINRSIMTLGKCIATLRYNQDHP